MDSFIDTYKKSGKLHHAYFFIGSIDKATEKLLNFFEKDLKYSTHGNPDFKYLKFENLSMDDAREIRVASERKNFSDDKMIFLVSAESVSLEAQNSLLKVFEEPTPDTYFFIVSPQDNLIPTLKSRMQVYKLESLDSGDQESILKMSLKDRLSKVKEITEAISDEEATKQEAVSFVNQIEAEIYKKGVEKSGEALTVCADARISLFDRGAPIKMILENLVLSI